MDHCDLIIAAGGTGGHLFPGIAVAHALIKKHPEWKVLFVGSERNVEGQILKELGLPHVALKVGRLKGEGVVQQFKTIFSLPFALRDACRILKTTRPRAVFGIGGYSSGPMIMAAWLKGIPRAILEPNAIPGMTNRYLARFVNYSFIAFEKAAGYFKKNTVLSGTPVREDLIRVGENRKKVGATLTPFRLTILGGSQGARSLNTAMIDMASRLAASNRPLHIVHQTGAADVDRVKKAYEINHISHEVTSFLGDMARVYAESHLVICRSGASTMAELMATKTPAILVPYPHAADNHQQFNASGIVDRGGGEMILDRDLGTLLLPRIQYFLEHPEELNSFWKQFDGRYGATDQVSGLLEEMMHTRKGF